MDIPFNGHLLKPVAFGSSHSESRRAVRVDDGRPCEEDSSGPARLHAPVRARTLARPGGAPHALSVAQ
jgi:hypothetical protein